MHFRTIPYTRPSTEELQNQLTELQQEASKAKSGKELAAVLNQADQFQRHWRTLAAIVHIRFTQNVTDDFWRSEKIFWEQISPELQQWQRAFINTVVEHPHRADAVSLVGARLFEIYDHAQRTFDPAIKPLLRQIAELEREYTELTGILTIDFRGQSYTVTQIRSFFQSPDRQTRQEATIAFWTAMDQYAEQLDTIYDQLVRLRHQQAQQLGFANYTELRYLEMLRTDYTQTDVAKLRRAIQQRVVPLVSQLRKEQAQRLGIDHLYVYDEPLFFPDGNAQPAGEPQWILQQAEQMYRELSDETHQLMHHLLQDGFIDVLSRPGKAMGGYCIYLPDYRSSFIFANFNGTTDDIRVLTHEFGHAFQQDRSSHLPFLAYMSPTLELAEVHSMGMEFLTYPWMSLFFKEATPKFYVQHLFSALSFLCYAAAVDEFQHWVYDHPTATASQRLECWRQLEQRYLPWRDNAGIAPLERGRLWQQQLHIYRAPFYYIDYALAQLCAFQIWLDAQKDYSNTVQRYQQLCQLGGSLSFLHALQSVGWQSPFDHSTLAATVAAVHDQLQQHIQKAVFPAV